MSHTLAIASIEEITHNVRQLTFEKPEGFEFTPGQAAEVGIDKDGWRDAGNPFTFTALPEWDELQFTIKVYPSHDGLTEQIGKMKVGDSFIVGDPWGTIEYKGKGTFIAGGAGVTPFIAILRMLKERGELSGHRLIFANKREADIILRDEFDAMPGLEVVYVLSEEKKNGFEHGRIDKPMLERLIGNTDQQFYVCGPDDMVESINDALRQIGADPDGLVFEE
ncbi:ferredoxin reductase domain-containing protein [Hoeflea alexandrii]|uniref:Flavodoxin reductase n=1 Tax=Hoeflea alexandrii TaxID=288436 RepID=A0ABT1CSL3_9HYPH|nr:flavodoxin reductase [Hoeflea alexandrii]MCO6409138.1 flavodoxin reductase [Hoeflea alexandrii]